MKAILTWRKDGQIVTEEVTMVDLGTQVVVHPSGQRINQTAEDLCVEDFSLFEDEDGLFYTPIKDIISLEILEEA